MYVESLCYVLPYSSSLLERAMLQGMTTQCLKTTQKSHFTTLRAKRATFLFQKGKFAPYFVVLISQTLPISTADFSKTRPVS